ncbi:MAG: hypothetical protein M3Z54_12235 [Gemmatimonadota bacterium]|nr:hypothetical protein [Gemmatimonadota bacterium]
MYRGLLQKGHNLSRDSDEAGADGTVKTEDEYRKLLAIINSVITNHAHAATGDRIALRDAVCAYLEVEQARGTSRTRVIQILEEILRKAEEREARGDARVSRNSDLAKQLVAWCVESRGTGGKLGV